MAQGKVTDFFATKKRNASANPSKRRKVEITTGEVTSQLDITNVNPHRNALDFAEEPAAFTAGPETKKENAVFSPLQTRAGRKAKGTKTPGPKITTRVRKTALDSKQKLIADAFSEAVSKSVPAVNVVDSVTSSWDDHDGPTTPEKATEKTNTKSRKRTRGAKTVETELKPSEVTPEKRKVVEPKPAETKAKKKLQLKSKQDQKDEVQENAASVEETAPSKTIPILPEPVTMKETKQAKMSANVEAALKKAKALKEKTKAKSAPKLTAEEVKAKLGKTGKLEDLKNQLSQIKEASSKVKASKLKDKAKNEVPALKKFDHIEVEVPSDVKKTVPAYERFHHLAQPSAPTLSLPYRYRLLAEQFRGMDTVVSMLHNRNEVCTFSKLKAAVQEFTKKNFEEKAVGQIKTVYPTAYDLRQEKGISSIQGFRDPKYQLTVTPNLDESEDSETARKVHQHFKASHLLTRRNRFHNGLIHIVKQHHKVFLSKLAKPLSVPDDKVTRWHPKFPLDEVPEVEVSELPPAPDTNIMQTARDVLEKTRGKVMPQVQAALEKTAKEEKSNTPVKPSTQASSTNATTPTAKPASGGFASLLERVRAKEAVKTAEAITRNPTEEKRTSMLKRLPGMMRIIRAQFVTEKRPALTIDSVVQKVLDSYKSCIAPGDVEPHIKLCIEVLPEWMSLIQIKKGKYLKIDKNLDLQTLTNKVENIAKAKTT